MASIFKQKYTVVGNYGKEEEITEKQKHFLKQKGLIVKLLVSYEKKYIF